MEYNPKHFKINDEEKCLQIAKEISFASIIYTNDGKIEVAHNPVFIDAKNKKVWGHFAKVNPASKCVVEQEVLITFQGEHGLIKPEWYGESGSVPTWNYVVIHIRGRVKTFNKHESLKKMLKLMSTLYKIEDMDIPERMLDAITGFQLDISEVDGKAKLGQNKTKGAIENAIKHLTESGNLNLAHLMKNSLK